MENQGKNPILLPNVNAGNCFACGQNNPIGLKMRFFLDNDQVYSRVRLTENHVGWEHMAHGGLISTLLDEVMSWAALALERRFVVTRKMEVRFLRPVMVGTSLTLKGRVDKRDHRGCMVQGLLEGEDGRRSASASAQMIFLPEKRVREIPEPFQSQTLEIFRFVEEAVAGQASPAD